MKKFLGVIVFAILIYNSGFAEEANKPEFNNNFNNNIILYKWKHVGSFKAQDGIPVQKLRKGKWHLYYATLIKKTMCWLP